MRTSRYFILLFITCNPFFLLAQSLDQFGGYTGKKGETTNRWHIQKIDNRHWFVTPEGHPMYIIGVNHIDTETEADRDAAITNLTDMNFNCSGYGMPDFMLSSHPGFLGLKLHRAAHWLPANQFHYTDVFSEKYAREIDQKVKAACEVGTKDKRIIGYSLSDTPHYELDISRRRRGTDWVSFVRELKGSTAGKQRYVSFLKQRYDNDFLAFQQAYRLGQLENWEAAANYDFDYLELTRPKVRADDELFLSVIVEEMYRLIRKSFDRYDPEALVVGEKLKSYDHTDDIIRLTGKYFDAVSIQAGPTEGPDVGQGTDESVFDATYWEKLHQLSGKPVLITDHGFSFYTPEHPRTLWHQFLSEEKAAEFYDGYIKQVIQLPYVIGYIKCQYRDRYDPLRDLLKQGFIQENGKPYPTLSKQMKETNGIVFKQLYRK